jgi:hypothetical protein
VAGARGARPAAAAAALGSGSRATRPRPDAHAGKEEGGGAAQRRVDGAREPRCCDGSGARARAGGWQHREGMSETGRGSQAARE